MSPDKSCLKSESYLIHTYILGKSIFKKATFNMIVYQLFLGHFIGENKGVEAEENVRVECLLANPSDGIGQIPR